MQKIGQRARLPRVSVIIPTYNRRGELAECLASVLAQSLADFEVVVVDDGSTDGTQSMIAAVNDDRMVYLSQPNGGPAKARNTGIRAARGEFIAFQDSDDLWSVDKLQRQLALFDDDPELGWAYCDMSYFGSAQSERRATSFASVPPLAGQVLKEMFVHGCPMHTPCTIVRRACLLETRMFDERLWAHEDIDVWLQLARRYKVAYVDAPLVQCRRAEDRPAKNVRLALETMCLVKRSALEENPWLRKECGSHELELGYYRHVINLAYHLMQTGEGAQARALLRSELDFRANRWRGCLFLCGTYFPRGFIAMRGLRQRLRKMTQQTARPSPPACA